MSQSITQKLDGKSRYDKITVLVLDAVQVTPKRRNTGDFQLKGETSYLPWCV